MSANESIKEVLKSIEIMKGVFLSRDDHVTKLLGEMNNRIGQLEKKIMEPIAQRIVDNVTQYSGCVPPIRRQMDFLEAIKIMRQGFNVTRSSIGFKHKVCIKNGVFKCYTGEEEGYLMLGAEDIEAKDWVIL